VSSEYRCEINYLAASWRGIKWKLCFFTQQAAEYLLVCSDFDSDVVNIKIFTHLRLSE